MSGWTKGPRCGVDNCPSRFYRVLGGNRVCQNGHVREGVETAGDDDDFGAFGRRMRAPGKSSAELEEYTRYARSAKAVGGAKGGDSQILQGAKAHALLLECQQDILRLQLRFLVDEKKLPSDIEVPARNFWGCITSELKTKRVTLIDLLAICYASCIALRAPVFISDLLNWVSHWQMPFMEAASLLDAEKLAKLPVVFVQALRPNRPPEFLRLHTACTTVLTTLIQSFHCSFPEPPWQALVFKATRDLLLPPQVYSAALRILQMVRWNPTGFKRTRVKRYVKDAPELQVYSAVVAAAKLCYGLDGVDRQGANDSAAEDHPDWQVWQDLIRKLYLLEPDVAWADERLVQYWDAEQVDDYISWYQYYFGREKATYGNEREVSVAQQQRVRALFRQPTQVYDPRPAPGPVDSDTIKDLHILLYSIPNDEPEPSTMLPGSSYKIWTAARQQPESVLPELTETLYTVLSRRFVGSTADAFRTMIETVEKWVRDENSHVYDELEDDGDLAWVNPSRKVGHHWRKKKSKPQSTKLNDTPKVT